MIPDGPMFVSRVATTLNLDAAVVIVYRALGKLHREARVAWPHGEGNSCWSECEQAVDELAELAPNVEIK